MNCACGRVRRAHHIFPVASYAKPTTIPGLCLPGTSKKSAASEDFTWCARRTLPQVEPCCRGLLPICTPISQPHGLPDRDSACAASIWWPAGPRCCRLATVSGGQVVSGTAGCGRWYLRANPLRMVRRRFSPASLPRRLKAFSLETSAPVGEGGRSHRAGPGPILSRQADSQ